MLLSRAGPGPAGDGLGYRGGRAGVFPARDAGRTIIFTDEVVGEPPQVNALVRNSVITSSTLIVPPERPECHKSVYTVVFSRRPSRNIRENRPLEVAFAATAAIKASIGVNPYRVGKSRSADVIRLVLAAPARA